MTIIKFGNAPEVICVSIDSKSHKLFMVVLSTGECCDVRNHHATFHSSATPLTNNYVPAELKLMANIATNNQPNSREDDDQRVALQYRGFLCKAV